MPGYGKPLVAKFKTKYSYSIQLLKYQFKKKKTFNSKKINLFNSMIEYVLNQ